MDEQYRVDIKGMLKKFGVHKVARLSMLNDLCDEINAYYVEGNGDCITSEFHEQHLKEQLVGWIKYLTDEKDKLDDNSEYEKGVKDGFIKVIRKLSDVAKQ